MSIFREHLRELVAREARPTHKFGHQVRLYRLCREIGKESPYDDEVVFAAVWLHDIGVFDGNRPSGLPELASWDHVAYAVMRSREVLPSLGFSPEKVERVVAAIREHQPQDTPTSMEATIVRDADILEQLGSIAVLRTAAKLGSDTRYTSFEEVVTFLDKQLLTLPSKLVLTTSRSLAHPRIVALENFLSAYKAELTA